MFRSRGQLRGGSTLDLYIQANDTFRGSLQIPEAVSENLEELRALRCFCS